MVMELEVSTSPRSTWVWAHDDEEAARLQVMLLAANCSVRSASGRNSESRVLDIDIGYEAFDAVKVLLGAGYSFRWHPDQYVLNRRPTLFGFPIVDPDDEWQQEADERESGAERLQELEVDEHFNATWDADQAGT